LSRPATVSDAPLRTDQQIHLDVGQGQKPFAAVVIALINEWI
jgi:hypothetical protein